MIAPVGTIVRVVYDPKPGARIVRGDVIMTKTGRMYRVLDYRMQRRGQHPGRLTISCLVIDKMPVDERESFRVSHDYLDAPDGAEIEREDGLWERRCETWYPRGTIQVHDLHWYSRDKKAKP